MERNVIDYLEALVAGIPSEPPRTGTSLDGLLDRLVSMITGLRQSEEKYRLVTEHVSIGIIVVQEGRFRYVNPAALEVTGYTAEEMLGREFAPLIHPDDLALVADRHVRRLRGEPVEPRYDFRVVRRDGGIAWVQLAAVVIPWDGTTATLSFINDITERKQTELALQRSEDRYRNLIDSAPHGMGIVIVRSNRVVLSNPALQQMLGMSAEAISAQESFLDVVHPEDMGEMLRVARGAVARDTGSEVVSTFRILDGQGRAVWVEGNSVQIEWEGKPATLAFIRDISMHRRLEQQIEEALADRDTMLDNSVVGIAFLSPEGRLRWANRPMAQIFGTDVVTKVGSSLEPYYLSREEYLRIGGAVSRAVMAGQAFTEEVQMRRSDGRPFWVYLSGRAVNPKDLSRGTVWVVMDITQRKSLEDALQRKTSEQEAILQSTQIGITLSVDRVHQWCNATFAEMLGYPPEALIGQSSRMHFPDEKTWRALGEVAYPVLASGEAYNGEVALLRRDGSLIWVQLHGKAVDPSRPDRGSIWTFVDITQRRQAEIDIRQALEQQRELNELKSRFVSMTSHEFRTPLATILSSTELLRYYDDRLPVAEKREILGSIEAAVQRMTQMLDGILMIGRADAGKLEYHPATIVPGPTVRAIAEESARAIGGMDRLAFSDAVGEIPWSLDEKLLRHVVGNLVSNAYKYSPGGGAVDVRLAVLGGELNIVVADHGIGIPAEDLPRLFETFHRATNVGTISGTGLGLSIVRRAVELSGGRIAVDSVLGQGTTFRVILPERNPTHAQHPVG